MLQRSSPLVRSTDYSSSYQVPPLEEPSKPMPWQWVAAGVVVVAVGGVIVWLEHDHLLRALTGISHWVRSLGFIGYLLSFFLVFLTSFPITIGHSTTLLFCGFSFGYPVGWLMAWSAATTGAGTCFALTRRWVDAAWLRNVIVRRVPAFPLYARAVERHGWKMLLLLRLSPLPFALTNSLLTLLSRLQLRRFMVVTAVATAFKVTLPVAIGASVESLTSLHASPWRFVGLAVTGLSAVLFIVTAITVRRAVARMATRETMDHATSTLPGDIVDMQVELDTMDSVEVVQNTSNARLDGYMAIDENARMNHSTGRRSEEAMLPRASRGNGDGNDEVRLLLPQDAV